MLLTSKWHNKHNQFNKNSSKKTEHYFNALDIKQNITLEQRSNFSLSDSNYILKEVSDLSDMRNSTFENIPTKWPKTSYMPHFAGVKLEI